jgi:hypothetical protein
MGCISQQHLKSVGCLANFSRSRPILISILLNICDHLLHHIGIRILSRQGGRLIVQNGKQRLHEGDLVRPIIALFYPFSSRVGEGFPPFGQFVYCDGFDAIRILRQCLNGVIRQRILCRSGHGYLSQLRENLFDYFIGCLPCEYLPYGLSPLPLIDLR